MLVRSRLLIHAAVAAAIIAVFSILAVSKAWALPLYMGNIGTFTVTTPRIQGTNYDLFLGIDGDSGSDGGSLPTTEQTFDTITLTDMAVQKSIDLSSLLGSAASSGRWNMIIEMDGDTVATDMSLNSPALCADKIFFGSGQTINGSGANTPSDTVEGVQDDFLLSGDAIELTNAQIEISYLAAAQMTLNNVNISVNGPGNQPERADYQQLSCAQ